MAELEILSMYVLTPMLVEYSETTVEGQPERHEEILLIDPVDNRIYQTTGKSVHGPLYDAIMEIVCKQKSPVKFLTEGQVAEIIQKKTEEEAHARKVES